MTDISLTALVCSSIASSPLPSIPDLAAAISPSLASKQPGSEVILSNLVAEAALAIMPKNPRDFNVDSVRVVKVLGGGLDASRVVRGMVFGREPEGELNFNLLIARADATHRDHQKRYQGQSRSVHLRSRHFPDGNKGHRAVEEG